MAHEVGSNLSPFLHPGRITSPASLAVLHLKRDHLLPTFLRGDDHDDPEYAEGPVTNTRFGSYPHSTLIGVPWGSQVLASRVDTGSRGRKGDVRNSSKRQRPDDVAQVTSPSKRSKLDTKEGENGYVTETPGERVATGTDHGEEALLHSQDFAQKPEDTEASSEPAQKQRKTASAAASGYCHILPPTPETWTLSLPHRTQVVYTPDYSYILQKIRLRPGCVVLEAGAGSGSFTHAAARAVFNGYPHETDADSISTASLQETRHAKPSQRYGRVYSYEYHAPRAAQLQSEIESHGLSSFVTVTHRDVYNSGFMLEANSSESHSSLDEKPQISPNATHVFLDLPAPWQALPHLTRTDPRTPLNPASPVHIAIFLPCIEQVQRAVTALRTHGWVEINMQELSQRRIDVRRDRIGLDLQGLRGVNASPATVDEACARLREVEMHGRRYLNRAATDNANAAPEKDAGNIDGAANEAAASATAPKRENKAERLARISKQASENKSAFRQGRLVTRTEPEIRTHTSYLVFAILPREWSSEDEEAVRKRWPVKPTKDKAAAGA